MPRMPVITFQDSTSVIGGFHLLRNIIILKHSELIRYLVVLYYQANKAFEKMDAAKKEADLMKMKEKYNLNTPGRG